MLIHQVLAENRAGRAVQLEHHGIEREPLVRSGDPYTIDQKTQDAAAQSALGPGNFLSHRCLHRRPCRHACGGRGRARALPLWPMAGGALEG